MCGLAAMIGPGVTSEDLKVIKDLSYVTGLRGTHSTGVFQTKKDYDGSEKLTAMDKQAMPVSDFLYLHSLKADPKKREDDCINNDLLNDHMCNLFMVHCRHATFGALTDENAHPFETKRYIGMHNGTLVDTRYTNTFDKEMSGKTDSERMFLDMDERGIARVLADLDTKSAYAVIIWDKQEKKLFIARNSLRTLFYANNKRRGVSYISSEIEMLRLATGRRNTTIGQVFYFEPGKLYSFEPTFKGFSNQKDGWEAIFSSEDLPEPTKKVYPQTRTSSFEERTKGSKETKTGSTVVRLKDLKGDARGSAMRRQKREDKFYCDDCSDYVYGHDKAVCEKMFLDDVTLLCSECLNAYLDLSKPVTPNRKNNLVIVN